MSFKKFITIIIAGVVISLVSFLLIIFLSLPQDNLWQLVIFYLSLFLLLLGVIFLVNLGLRIFFGQDTFYFNYINITFRQAALFATLLIVCLFLQGLRLFTWWNFLFLILAIIFLEFFALSRRGRVLKV